jgi:hypothetical protein
LELFLIPNEREYILRRQKAEGRRRIPRNKFRGLNKDVVFFCAYKGGIHFLLLFINKNGNLYQFN